MKNFANKMSWQYKVMLLALIACLHNWYSIFKTLPKLMSFKTKNKLEVKQKVLI